MTRGVSLCVILILAAGVAAEDKTADVLAGKWVVESVTRDGKADDALNGATRVHEGTKYTVTPAEGSKAPTVSGTFTADTSKMPITIDMKPEGGRYKGKTLLGIAKVDGDALTVAFTEQEGKRPTGFDSTPGSGVVVAVHKRAK